MDIAILTAIVLGAAFCTITSTQTEQAVRNVAVGRYISDAAAAAFNITCGFKPRYIKVINETSLDMYEWYEGMADASAVKTTAATSARSLIVTLGITPLAGGFTIGLDLDVNVISEQLSWVAMG